MSAACFFFSSFSLKRSWRLSCCPVSSLPRERGGEGELTEDTEDLEPSLFLRRSLLRALLLSRSRSELEPEE